MCFEYSWTVNQWFDHTFREIAIMLHRMSLRNKKHIELERSFHAAIHGIKLDDGIANTPEVKSNKEIDDKVEAYLKQRMKDKSEGQQ